MNHLTVNPTDRVFVCGGGNLGLSMAAHLALNGIKVTLWNRTRNHIEDVIETRKIECSGVVNGTASIEKASVDIADVISDFIMVTTTSDAHKDMARRLAPYVHKEMIIILNPGRTFGAMEFAQTLKACGVTELPRIAETQTVVYTCRRSDQNSTVIYTLKRDVQIATIQPGDVNVVLARMPECLRPHFIPVESVIITSLSNVGMVLHCAPVLMNIGWIETKKDGFKYYHEGISRSVAHFLEKIDSERVGVAKALGYEVETTADWLRRTYRITGKDLYECIQNNEAYEEIDAPHTVRHRYLLEDVPCGLVPIEDTAKKIGLPVPNITTMIDLVSSVLDTDFRGIGQKYQVDLHSN